MADARITSKAHEVVSERFPDLDPKTGPGAARRWNRLMRFAEVIEEYQVAQEVGAKSPVNVIAKARDVQPGTVRTWLFHAKKEGFDVPSKARIANTGDIVRHNVRVLRAGRRMSYAELSKLLSAVDRPIPVLGLRRLEEGDRRVDVDDLAALAEVFGTSPASLLELLPACTTCHGAPPSGFACTKCGASAPTPEPPPSA